MTMSNECFEEASSQHQKIHDAEHQGYDRAYESGY